MQVRPKVSFTIPEPPKDASPQLRQMLSSMKEALEVRLGRRGDPMEQGLTRRDLVESGIARLGVRGTSGPLLPAVVEPAEARTVPPVPAAFQAEGVFGGITLTWDAPTDSYSVHGFAEVWRSDSNNANTRVLLGSSRGSTYFDRVPDGGSTIFYYWVRFISQYDRPGPFSSAVQASKQADVDELMAKISGQIDQSDLSAAFQSDYQETKNTIATQSQTLSSQNASINWLAQISSGHSSALDQQGQAINGLAAQYTLKLDVNGYVSGIGAYNNGSTSQFVVVADQFWVAPPNSTGKTKPFIIDGGAVYMNTAYIKDASIQAAKIGSVTFGKVTDSYGNPVTTASGLLRADQIEVEKIQITDANIGGVIKSTAVAANGQPRWMLDKNGGMSMNGSGSDGGRMEMRDGVIKVFDAYGRLRVQMGDLQA